MISNRRKKCNYNRNLRTLWFWYVCVRCIVSFCSKFFETWKLKANRQMLESLVLVCKVMEYSKVWPTQRKPNSCMHTERRRFSWLQVLYLVVHRCPMDNAPFYLTILTRGMGEKHNWCSQYNSNCIVWKMVRAWWHIPQWFSQSLWLRWQCHVGTVHQWHTVPCHIIPFDSASHPWWFYL